MINRLSHTTLYVLDHDKAFDFYVNKLGFTAVADIVNEGFRWLTVQAPNQPDLEFALVKLEAGAAMNEKTVEYIQGLLSNGMASGVFETDDCRATYAELSQKGVEFLQEPRDDFYGTDAMFTDPFGNQFRLVQPA